MSSPVVDQDEVDPFELSGFWSYVHDDDSAEHGRIAQLCRLVAAEYEMRTATKLDIFLDRDSIEWGRKWRQTIDSQLNTATFFVAIVTPRYLKSKECRKEFNLYTKNAEARQMPELMLPILYIKTNNLREDSQDELISGIAEAQWLTLTDERLKNEQSEEYRTKISEIVDRLLDIAASIATKPEITSPPKLSGGNALSADDGADNAEDAPKPDSTDDDDDDDDDTPGWLENMALAEELLPEWSATLEDMGRLMQEITAITNDYAPRLQAASKNGAKAQVATAARYAKALTPTAQEFNDCGAKYAQQASDMNEVIVPILNFIAEHDYDHRQANGENQFLQTMKGIATEGRVAVEHVVDFQQSVKGVAVLSRTVRKPLTKISGGAQKFVDGQQLYDDWERRINEITETDPVSAPLEQLPPETGSNVVIDAQLG